MRSHLTLAHKNVIIKELRVDETMDPGSHSTLKTLKEDYGAVEKYNGDNKRKLDEQFVKMCCKKRMPLSMGTDFFKLVIVTVFILLIEACICR